MNRLILAAALIFAVAAVATQPPAKWSQRRSDIPGARLVAVGCRGPGLIDPPPLYAVEEDDFPGAVCDSVLPVAP